MEVDPVAIAGVWWRQVPHAADPLFRADPPSDGRWQRGETVTALYFSDSEATASAEWYRAIAESASPPDEEMPRDLWLCTTSWPERTRSTGAAPGRRSTGTAQHRNGAARLPERRRNQRNGRRR